MWHRSCVGFFAVALAALLPPVLLGPADAGAGPAGASCSVAGLHFSERREGVVEAVAVAGLRAKGVSCAKARGLAAKVARDMLRETKVPTTIAGLKVRVKEPCAGCTPDSSVVASSGAKAVTFTVKGGA